jgi:flagellar capping protein FliD
LTAADGKVPARINTLKTRIDSNDERVAFMEARLEVKKQMMLNKFYAMEQAMAKMSSDMSTVSGIATSWTSNYSSTGS